MFSASNDASVCATQKSWNEETYLTRIKDIARHFVVIRRGICKGVSSAQLRRVFVDPETAMPRRAIAITTTDPLRSGDSSCFAKDTRGNISRARSFWIGIDHETYGVIRMRLRIRRGAFCDWLRFRGVSTQSKLRLSIYRNDQSGELAATTAETKGQFFFS